MNNGKLLNELLALKHEHKKLQKAFDTMEAAHDTLQGLLYNQILKAKNLREVKTFIRWRAIKRAQARGYPVDDNGFSTLEGSKQDA
ncbi:TPA: hypothetical protein SCS57_002030 [Enterobacter cloacae]|nr:hypothetical protein [Enterobacter cloacae]